MGKAEKVTKTDPQAGKKKKISKKKKEPSKSNFLMTTYQMIQNEKDGGVIKWGAQGNSFIIPNTEQFLQILPKYFKTKNYASFVRQLNMYDFHKVKNLDGFHEFKHDNFNKDDPDSIEQIKRKQNDNQNVS